VATEQQKRILRSLLKTKETVVFENENGFIEVGLKYADGSLDTIEFEQSEINHEYDYDSGSWRDAIPEQFGEKLLFTKEQAAFLNEISGG